MKYSLRVLFLLCHLGLSVAHSEIAPPPPDNPKTDSLLPIGPVPVELLAAPKPDSLVVKIAGQPHVYHLNLGSKQHTKLFPSEPLVGAGFTLRYATTPSAKKLLIQHQFALGNRLWVFDLLQDSVRGVPIEETRRFSVMPAVSPDESEYLLFGLNSREATAWRFPLGEYLWDIAQKTEQPTGFYAEALSGIDYGPSVKAAAYSPDGTRVALSVGPTFARPAAYSEDEWDDDDDYSGGYTPRASNQGSAQAKIRILDLATRKFEEIPVPKSVSQVFWTSPDVIVWKAEPNYMDVGGVYKLTLSTKQSEKLTGERTASEEVSSDGRFLLYAPVATSPRALPVLEFLNIETGKKTEIRNISSAVFTPDSETLVMRAASSVSQNQPYARLPLAPYREGRGEASFDLKQAKDLERFGVDWDLYELPAHEELFQKHFEVVRTELEPFAAGFRFHVHLKNRGEHFLGSNTRKNVYVECALVDSHGKMLSQGRSSYSAYMGEGTFFMAPGDVRQMECVLSFRLAPAALKGGKVRYRLITSEPVFEGAVTLD